MHNAGMLILVAAIQLKKCIVIAENVASTRMFSYKYAITNEIELLWQENIAAIKKKNILQNTNFP